MSSPLVAKSSFLPVSHRFSFLLKITISLVSCLMIAQFYDNLRALVSYRPIFDVNLVVSEFSANPITFERALHPHYEPTWKSLDSRPLPSWYDEAKIGIFLHWGVFSVPSFEDAWFWYWWKGPEPRAEYVEFMRKNYPPDYTYADFAPDLTAEFYNPDKWAEIFNESGAKYVVLTSKHHEGFCMWPTNHSYNWNVMDVGPKRDLVGDLGKAIRKNTNLRFGIYHSLYEFFNPLLMKDKDNDFKTQEYVETKITPSLQELVHRYKPDLLWSDGPWIARDSYWNSTNFLAWLYNDSPVKDYIVTNDRWGRNTPCKHGGYLTCKDHFNPKVLWPRKFEDSTTMTKRGWSFQRNMNLSQVHSMEHMTKLIAQVVSCGGNILINVGPTKEGIIAPIFQERLKQMGDWLRVNSEAIYSSRPWTFQNDTVNSHVWYTKKVANDELIVYAIVLKWPDSGKVTLAAPVPGVATRVTMLGLDKKFSWSKRGKGPNGMIVKFPLIGYREVPCRWAWVLRITHIQN